MKTTVSGRTKQVLIGHDHPTVLIGERINPTGKRKLAAAMQSGDMELIKAEAVDQVNAGADILDVNVVAAGVDEIALLPRVIEEISSVVDVPLCLDFNDHRALEKALKVYQGKPIINSVTAEPRSLDIILPLVKDYGTAVIGLTIDEQGIPKEVSRRVEIAQKILERAHSEGIEKEDVIIDCLVLAIGSDYTAGLATLETICRIKEEIGVNQTIGASNISYAMPGRDVLNSAFLSMAIWCGVTCPTVDAAKVRTSVIANDLIMGRDRYARRYIGFFREYGGPNIKRT